MSCNKGWGALFLDTTLTLRIFFQKFEKTVMMPRIPDEHGLKKLGFNITKDLRWPNFSSTFSVLFILTSYLY